MGAIQWQHCWTIDNPKQQAAHGHPSPRFLCNTVEFLISGSWITGTLEDLYVPRDTAFGENVSHRFPLSL
ncbi:hypothetical protein XELAEV_18041499mg [Xenopus laevis]|uniref:Uncharacterized protein n=1 Tax=Xenopus laevis TaxID=8355 RepID=A0A974C2C9_XENLA|nr:hypothetical protein XELAEV_18041499mg [Xenopus laevis]